MALLDTVTTPPKKLMPGQTPGISPGQTPGINPGEPTPGPLGTSTGIPSPGSPGQSGQYGGINPGGGIPAPPATTQTPDTGPGGPVEPLPDTSPGGPVEPPPDTSPGGPVPTPPGVDPNQALQTVQQAFQARFNRAMTAEEQQLAIQFARQNGWSGSGPVPQSALDAVLAAIQTYQDPNAPGPVDTTQPLPTDPSAPVDPDAPVDPNTPIDQNVAQQRVQDAFLQRFGHPPSAQEWAWILQMSGYQQGGPVNQGMLDRAMDAIGRYSGDIENPIDNPPTPEEEEARRRLLELLGEEWGDVDPNSPALKAQRDAFGLASQRDTSRRRAALAERSAARGAINAGGFDTDVERLLSEEGEREQSFEANLIAGELGQQRQRLMQGIELAIQSGLQEDAQQLQEELARLDIELRRYLGQGQLGLGLLGQGQQNQQFYDNLGLNFAQLQAMLNNQAIQAILGGG